MATNIVNGKIYLTTTPMWVYDTINKKWNSYPSNNITNFYEYYNSIVYNNKIYYGKIYENAGSMYIYIYDTENNAWSQSSSITYSPTSKTSSVDTNLTITHNGIIYYQKRDVIFAYDIINDSWNSYTIPDNYIYNNSRYFSSDVYHSYNSALYSNGSIYYLVDDGSFMKFTISNNSWTPIGSDILLANNISENYRLCSYYPSFTVIGNDIYTCVTPKTGNQSAKLYFTFLKYNSLTGFSNIMNSKFYGSSAYTILLPYGNSIIFQYTSSPSWGIYNVINDTITNIGVSVGNIKDSKIYNDKLYMYNSVQNDGNLHIYNINSNTNDTFIIPRTNDTKPTIPSSISHNANTSKKIGNEVSINWGTSTDANGDSVTYELSFYDGSIWNIIYNGSLLTYNHTIPSFSTDTSNAKYRVRAYDGTLYSDYIESSTFELYIPVNTPPTTPPSITHNATVPKTLNDQVIVTWSASTDAENDPITYDLYFFDGKTWVAIKGNSTELTFTHSIPITSYNTTQAKYKVRAFDGNLYSDFIESSTFEIYGATNSPPTISGEDSDLGSLTDTPTNITYSVDDINDKDTLNVAIEINNDLIDFIGDVTRNQDYTVDLTDIWDSLEYNTEYTITISVTDGKDTAKRKYTFSRYEKINYLPTISGIDTNLGRQDFTFTQTYSIDDKDNTVDLTVTVKVDNTILNTIPNAVRNQIYTVDLSSIWDSLAVKEPHKITITVSDENSNTATRIYNFYKGNGNNHVPIIDGSDSNLSEKNKSFNQSFVINDSDTSDNVQVVIYLDGNIIDQTYNATRGFEYNISINSDLFNKLENDTNHTIQIVASDGIAITTRNYIFTKKDILEDYITLDVRFEYILPIIECKQDDDLTLKFKIENLGEDIDLTDYTIKFKTLKYDGSIYESTDIIKTNTGIVTVNCNENLTDIAGKAQCQVQIFDMNNNQYNTQLIDLFVRRNCTE